MKPARATRDAPNDVEGGSAPPPNKAPVGRSRRWGVSELAPVGRSRTGRSRSERMRTSTKMDDLVVAQDEESEPEPDVEEAPPPKPEADPEAPPPSDDAPYATFDAPSDPSNKARSPRRDAAREESAELRWLCRLEERTSAILVDDPPRCGLPVKPKPLMAVRPPLKPPFPEPEPEPELEPEPVPVPEVPQAAPKAS